MPCDAIPSPACWLLPVAERLAAPVSNHAVPHALIGAAALAVRGVARSTFDVDLVTTARRVLDADLWAPFVGTGVAVDCRRGDAGDPLVGVVRITAAGQRPAVGHGSRPIRPACLFVHLKLDV